MLYTIEHSWLTNLKSGYSVIREELFHFLRECPVSSLHNNYKAYTNKDGWRTIPLVFFTIENPEFITHFPKTHKIIQAIPELISAEFSILLPGTEIRPHIGYSKQVMRTHLGLKVPDGDIGFKTESESVSWEEGDTFSFNDGELHEAWNRTEEDRWVLMIDTPVPGSAYGAKEIARYKFENLTDEVLLRIAPKEEWLRRLE